MSKHYSPADPHTLAVMELDMLVFLLQISFQLDTSGFMDTTKDLIYLQIKLVDVYVVALTLLVKYW